MGCVNCTMLEHSHKSKLKLKRYDFNNECEIKPVWMLCGGITIPNCKFYCLIESEWFGSLTKSSIVEISMQNKRPALSHSSIMSMRNSCEGESCTKYLARNCNTDSYGWIMFHREKGYYVFYPIDESYLVEEKINSLLREQCLL